MIIKIFELGIIELIPENVHEKLYIKNFEEEYEYYLSN